MIQSMGSDQVQPHSKFEELKEGINKENAKKYFEKVEGKPLSKAMVNIKSSNLLEKFILS